MPIVKCQNCAKEFTVKPYKLNTGRGKFCSLECRMTGAVIECQQCRVKFYASRSVVESGRKKFCSKKCANIAKTELHGPEHPLWNHERIECDICGAVFYREPNMNAKYCSVECRNIANTYRTGDKHPLWVGGSSLYPTEWGNKLKGQIHQRDGNSCVICGIDISGSNRHVHHIDYDKANCNHNNLVTLCRSCHTKTNTKRQSWTAMLSDIVSSMRLGGFLWM